MTKAHNKITKTNKNKAKYKKMLKAHKNCFNYIALKIYKNINNL